MSSFKAQKPPVARQWLIVLGIGLISLISGCYSTGTIYVSHPQIHTRERLVEQRQREQEWLKDQLEVADKIEATYQGLRDFREFVGFYNELAVAFNPAQGKLDQITNEARAAEAKTQLWKQRTAELDAYRNYMAALKADGGTDTTTTSAGQDTEKTPTAANETEEPPDIATPYGTAPKDITLPTPKDVVETKAKPHPLDLFYDRMAYRNAVNAALKSNQLDDSHDFAGQMLYELTLFVSLTPGNHSQQFAQVELEIQYDPLEKRAPQIARLYNGWVDALKMNMAAKIVQMQRRLMEHNLTEYDRRYLRWFVDGFGQALYLQLKDAFEDRSSIMKTRDEVIPDISELTLYDWLSKSNEKLLAVESPAELRDKTAQIDYSFTEDDINKLKGLLDTVYKFVRAQDLDQLIDKPSSQELVTLLEVVAWAIWGSHYIELNRVVGITPPQVNEETGFLSGGLVVKERIGYDSTQKKMKDVFHLIPAFSESQAKITNSGVKTFIKKLYNLEKASYAAMVQPKEYAQNISEASARETMLNLVLAISAMLPNSGVKAKNKSQYVKRAQTYLHAITRQPLLVGYGNGERCFGWFLGPAFTVKDGKADFVHRVVRHDVSAGIVVPAWWNYVRVRGKQFWVDASGRSNPVRMRPLWDDGGEIYLSIRPPERIYDYITQALLANNISGDPYRYTSRPHPVIESPTKQSVIRVQAVRADKKDTLPQQVLVLGRDLWRSPQIFLGSIKADAVEVLSNMEGVLATFNRIPYLGTFDDLKSRQSILVDLTVITSFGRDRSEGAIEILPPPD